MTVCTAPDEPRVRTVNVKCPAGTEGHDVERRHAGLVHPGGRRGGPAAPGADRPDDDQQQHGHAERQKDHNGSHTHPIRPVVP